MSFAVQKEGRSVSPRLTEIAEEMRTYHGQLPQGSVSFSDLAHCIYNCSFIVMHLLVGGIFQVGLRGSADMLYASEY
jgi:hypothetical protein